MPSLGNSWYVTGKDLTKNQLIVVQATDHPLLYQTELTASQLHWVTGQAPATTFRASAKTHYRQVDPPCDITLLDGQSLHVVFDTPQRAITPGQSLVIYHGDVCFFFGGGIIH